MEKRKWLMCCVVALTMMLGAMKTEGAIMVTNGDLLAGQSDPVSGNSGFNYRYTYNTWDDAYYKNGNYATPDLLGWQAGTSWSLAVQRNVWGTAFLSKDSDGGVAAIQWTFDVSSTGKTIDKLMVRIPINHANAQGVASLLYIGTSNGETWYQNNWSNYWSLYPNYYDLTSQLVALGGTTTSFTVKAIWYPAWFASVQLMPSGSHEDMGLSFDVQMTLIPEPATLVLLGLGSLLSLRRRKNK